MGVMKVQPGRGNLDGGSKEKRKAREAAFSPTANARAQQIKDRSVAGFKGEVLNDHGLPMGGSQIIQKKPKNEDGAKFRSLAKYAKGTSSVEVKDEDLDAVLKDAPKMKVGAYSAYKDADMEKVRQHQIKLNKYGANLKVDGMWGKKTEAASRELYPQYKAKPAVSKSTSVKSKSDWNTNQTSKAKGRQQSVVDSTEAGKFYQDREDSPTQTRVMKTSSQVKVKTGKPQLPEYELGILDRLLGGEEAAAKLERDKAKTAVYERDLKAYDERVRNKGLDDADSIRVANGLEPSERYKTKQANAKLFDKEVARQTKGATIKSRNGQLFDKEVSRQIKAADKKGQNGKAFDTEKKRQMQGIRNQETTKEYVRDATQAIARDSTQQHLADRVRFNSGGDTNSDREEREADANWKQIKAQADFEVAGEKARSGKKIEKSTSIPKKAMTVKRDTTTKRVSSSATVKSSGKLADNSVYTDHPSSDAIRAQRAKDSTASKRSNDYVESKLAKNRKSKGFKEEKRKKDRSIFDSLSI